MKKITFLILVGFAVTAQAQFGGMRDIAPQTFDSSDIFADRIVKSTVPVMIDFWATWCMPCRMLAPTVEELKKKYSGKIKVMKIDVDVHRRIAAYFRVSSIPAVFIIKDKAVVQYIPGLQDKSAYEQAIAEVLKSKPSQAMQQDSVAGGQEKK